MVYIKQNKFFNNLNIIKNLIVFRFDFYQLHSTNNILILKVECI